MKRTIDTLSGRIFSYNNTVLYLGYNVPSRETRTASHPLAPDRVPRALLRALNPTADISGNEDQDLPYPARIAVL